MKRNTSKQMIQSLSQEHMALPTLHQTDLPRGTLTARLQHEERLQRALGSIDKSQNRVRGSIPGYGNFSALAGHMVRINGRTAM